MEDLNPMSQINPNPEPVKEGGSIKKVIWIVVGIIIVLFIVLAVLAVIGNQPLNDSSELTEAEKQSLMEVLEQNPGPELTNEERTSLVEVLQDGANQAPELSEQEKQSLLDVLNQ